MPCDSPYYVLPKGALESVPVPCGRCPPCKKRRVDSWVFRLMKEQRRHSHCHFITLTYDTHAVPISDNGFMSLDKSAFPRFVKRLRKLLGNDHPPIRYYACGEYGSKNKRPHYHAIVFGVANQELFFKAWHLDGKAIGTVHVGQVSGDSIAYCMKYIDKSNFKANHDRDDRVPEFALMSKGLGSNYLSQAVKNYHLQDYSRMFLTKEDGHKIAMPRYYKTRIYDADDSGEQRRIIQLAMEKREEENYNMYQRLVDTSKMSFDEWKESQKMQRYKHFYNVQKDRKL